MNHKFNSVFNGITVLVTGHTGFKGSWLSIWLEMLGANVVGFSLPELPTNINNFQLSNLDKHIIDIRGDVRDVNALIKVINDYQPKLVFHLAAQPILHKSYDDPKTTFDTNAGGTVNILEAVRQTNCVEALVCITTDKVYKNNEWVWGYRETDQLGDKDPYAAGKAMAELAIESYRSSFFSGERMTKRKVAVASTRAGNVIGGGDFADLRLIPDIMKSLIVGSPIELRNPYNVRPWQLVLEPLSGYLALAEKLLTHENKHDFTKAWNFGPNHTRSYTAGEITDLLIKLWGKGSWINTGMANNAGKHESNLLMLDSSAAQHKLGWKPVYNTEETLDELVKWYREYARQNAIATSNIDMYPICVEQIQNYVTKAESLGIDWSK